MAGKILLTGALIGSVLLAMFGCAGVSATGYAVGDGTYNVLREIANPHAFSATVPVTWMENCKKEVKIPYTWQESVWGMEGERTDWHECTRLTAFQFNPTTGYADGLGKAVVYGGAAVGTGYLIGDGLSKSGNNVSQSGGGAKSSQSITTNQTQTNGGGPQQAP